jgi:hypothetical protein
MLFAVLAAPQATIVSIADVTGDGSAHALSVSAIQARTIDLTAPTTNTGVCRTGDASIGTSRGQPIAAGGSYHYAQLPSATNYTGASQMYNLAAVYYYCPVGDKLAVIYAK